MTSMTNRLTLRRHWLLTVISVILISGCASQPIEINHYLLNIVRDTPTTANTSDTVFVNVKQVNLPEYLQSRSLVMQNDDETLSIATKHVWAEPLDADFGMLLANSLSQFPSLSGFYRMPSRTHSTISDNAKISIVVNVEHFMPLQRGDVVLSGIWMTEHDGKLSAPHSFQYSRPLEQDGYAHSVARMRTLVSELADEIAATLTKTSPQG
ncbi:PqiC family protein [Alteromonas oceanisediminis]|uniref:PqiC family protein n=1 Tax=Alteromonas oceanisediminis TaxID=2836180 RepID=UPI001BD938C2|nr:ABC-type transport auxiliary lipoprotein family protein [Alteromonas oceanisediminis]MBT0587622.1 membrane integrity-associated transporter subunit PqiC [Alteromonas oceanisediminis]